MGYKAVEQIRQNVKTLLVARKVNQKDLADAIGRHPTTLNKFLQGTREIQLKDLDAMADFFGIRPYELFQPGGSTLTERRLGQERRTGHERRVGHARRMMKTVAAEVVRVWRKGPALKHGETIPAGDSTEAALEALVVEFEQRAAPLLAAATAPSRRQITDHRREGPAVPPAVRPAGGSRPKKGNYLLDRRGRFVLDGSGALRYSLCMTNTNRLTSAAANTLVIFHGYDGNDYTAFVTRVRRGIATLAYSVYVGGIKTVVTAYISDASRITRPGR